MPKQVLGNMTANIEINAFLISDELFQNFKIQSKLKILKNAEKRKF